MPEMAALQGWLDAYVEAWRTNDPADSECRYEALAVTGEIGVARGWTRYRASAEKPAREYKNLFVIRFDVDGRSGEFTEWYAEPPATTDA